MGRNSIAVFGFGKTGRALLDFLFKKSEFSDIYLYNDSKLDMSRSKIIEYLSKNIKFYFEADGFKEISDLVDTVVLSPGFNGRESRFDELRENGVRVISEIEFSYEYIDTEKTKVIAVTGTNGKSTTVSLIYHLLRESGLNTFLAGNIGNPFISEIDKINAVSDSSFVVLELSSFQLEDIERFKPDIALILNITPDHLNRYKDMSSYLNAKLNILKNRNSNDFFIYNKDDDLLKRLDAENNLEGYGFSLKDNSADIYIYDEKLIYKNLGKSNLSGQISLDNNPLRGIHNLENIMAAVTVAIIIGISLENIEKSIASFQGLKHRTEFAGSYNGVEFINDSKATNVDATIKSSKSFNEDMVIILGGQDKGSSFEELDEILLNRAKGILLIGAAKEKIATQLTLCNNMVRFVNDFDEAVSVGYDIIKENGGVLLLAPACASFDMFENFEERGDSFKISVNAFIKEMQRGNNG
jgi:UDP-N-acetylmuramoylalanine--D-glutamate ligase